MEINDALMDKLQKYLEKHLVNCHGEFTLCRSFATLNGVSPDKLVAKLEEMGFFCDCDFLNNWGWEGFETDRQPFPFV